MWKQGEELGSCCKGRIERCRESESRRPGQGRPRAVLHVTEGAVPTPGARNGARCREGPVLERKGTDRTVRATGSGGFKRGLPKDREPRALGCDLLGSQSRLHVFIYQGRVGNKIHKASFPDFSKLLTCGFWFRGPQGESQGKNE